MFAEDAPTKPVAACVLEAESTLGNPLDQMRNTARTAISCYLGHPGMHARVTQVTISGSASRVPHRMKQRPSLD